MNTVKNSRGNSTYNGTALERVYLKSMKSRAPTGLAPRSLPPLPNHVVFQPRQVSMDKYPPSSVGTLSHAVGYKYNSSLSGDQSCTTMDTPSHTSTRGLAATDVFGTEGALGIGSHRVSDDTFSPCSPPPPYFGPRDDDSESESSRSTNSTPRPPSYFSSLNSLIQTTRSLPRNDSLYRRAVIKQRRMLPSPKIAKAKTTPQKDGLAFCTEPKRRTIEDLLASLPPPPSIAPPVPPS